MTGSNYPKGTVGARAAADNAGAADPDVGEVLRRLDASRALSGPELERHIADCELLWKRAYDRFQDHHNPADRDEALVWLHRMNEAILMRSPGVQARRHAAFERLLAAGEDRALLQTRGAD